MNGNLLEGANFQTLSQDVQVNLDDIDFNQNNMDEIAVALKGDDYIDDGMLAQFKSCKNSLLQLIPDTEMLLDELADLCYQKKQETSQQFLAFFI